MASHHSHHHHHHPHPHSHQNSPLLTTTTTAAAPCCCCDSHCCTQSPPPPSLTDPLLQAIASHILQQQPPPPPHQPHLYSPFPNDPFSPQHHKNHQNQHFHHHHHHQQQKNFQPQEKHHHTHFTISSLLRRIDALESSIRHFSSSAAAYSHFSSYSLRDIAARVIQTHFRAFLVRRSRALRQLKDLALIKSSFNSLKFSISNKSRFDYEAVSQKAIDLLLELDSIQGGDPMIRDGKRSISRGLVRFLELIEGYAATRREISYKAAKNVKYVAKNNRSRVLGSKCGDLGRDEREKMEKLRGRLEKIRVFSRVSENEDEDVELEGFRQVINDDEEEDRNGVSQIRKGVSLKRHVSKPRVKKSVSFAENGNVYWVLDNTHEPVPTGGGNSSDGSVSSDDQGEVMENIYSGVEGINGLSKETEDNEEDHMENGGSPQSSDGERNPIRNLSSHSRSEGNKNFVFSAPLPVKMDSRADLMKRNALKIVK